MMEWMLNFNVSCFTPFEYSALLKIVMASVCGGIIGIEREIKGRPAGLKTFSLVCLGSALVMITNDYIYQFRGLGTGDITRMAAQVVSGIGFLGAGSIIVTGCNQVKGLTTAAALWVTAALGIAIGSGFYFGAAAGLCVVSVTAFVFKWIDRKIIERSRHMTLYIDGECEGILCQLLEYFKQKNIHISDLIRKEENKWYAEDVCAVIVIKLEKRYCHKKILEEIRRIEGIRFVEEI